MGKQNHPSRRIDDSGRRDEHRTEYSSTSNDRAVTPEETEQALQSVRARLGLSPSKEVSDTDASDSDIRDHLTVSRSESGHSTLTKRRWQAALAMAASLVIGGIMAVWVQPTRIDVPAGDPLSLSLPDGSTIELAGGSTITYGRGFGRTHRNVTLTGHAYFDIDPNELPFIAKTGSIETRVTGTRFTLIHWPDEERHDVRLSLYSGSVDFVTGSDTSQIHQVTPGTGIHWNGTTRTVERYDRINEQRERIWERGGISFEDTPLRTVLAAIEQIYDIRLELDSRSVSSDRVTLYYPQFPALESILTDLAQVRGLQLSRTQNGYRLTRARGI